MSQFYYRAIKKDGQREESTIEAISLIAAGHLLKEQGLLPIEVKPLRQSFATAIKRSIGSVSFREKILFIENLHIMIKSGIAAPRALKMIATQTKNPKFQNILYEIAARVESGKSLHEAMEGYPKIFSFIFVSMVRAGEMSGTLEKSLEYLSVQLERDADIRSKVKSAMMYPGVILSAMVIIGTLMGIFVLPQLTSIFKDFSPDKLPATTQAVIWVSDFFSNHSVLVVIGLIIFAAIIVALIKTTPGRRVIDWVLLRAFIFGPIVQKINLARFSRVLSSMLKSGIPIIDGLQVASQTVGNYYYQTKIEGVAASVKTGRPLTETLEGSERLFPFLIVQMLKVGEETGTLDAMLEQLAVQYEGEVDTTMKNLSSIIEPLLLLVIGAVVGVLALALIAPIYSISESIQ